MVTIWDTAGLSQYHVGHGGQRLLPLLVRFHIVHLFLKNILLVPNRESARWRKVRRVEWTLSFSQIFIPFNLFTSSFFSLRQLTKYPIPTLPPLSKHIFE